MLGSSPRPLTISPLSFNWVCFVRLLSPRRFSTLDATSTPWALYQGPLPMRSRALTPVVPVVLR